MTDEQKTILQDLIDDVEDYATSREFKPRETEWRRELLLKARALLAAPLANPSRKQEAMKAHAIDCGYIQSDNPWAKCTCGFGGPNDAAPIANPSDKQEADGVAVTASGAEYHNPRKAYAEAEEAGCVRMWLDDLGAPIGDDAGTFSLVGRIRAHFANPSDKQEAVIDCGECACLPGFCDKSAEQDRIDAELFQRLLHARSELGRTIADPMWADHGEVTKAALKRWHGTIDEVIKGASK